MFDIRWRGSPRGKAQTFPTSLGTESHSVSVSLIAYTYWLATAVERIAMERWKSRTNRREVEWSRRLQIAREPETLGCIVRRFHLG